jgi:L-iditol 2-dehydrogenase
VSHTTLSLRLHGPHDARFHDEEVRTPAPGEVLLEIRSVGVCRSDLDYWIDGRIGDMVVEVPLILGHEFSARVIEAGPGADPALVGRRVAVEPGVSCLRCEWCMRGDTNLCPQVLFCGVPGVDGALRRLMPYPAAFIAPLPDNVSDDAGALLEPLAIGVHVLDLARPRLETTAAVVGVGPVGLSVLQAARAAGVGRLIALDRLDWRLEAAMKLGATDAVKVQAFDGGDAVDHQRAVDALMALTRGRGVDHVYEAAGADDSAALAIELAAPAGKVFLVGIPRGGRTEFSASISRRRGLTVYVVRRSRPTLHRALAMLSRGALNADALITHRFPFAQATEAFDLAHNYSDGVIKAVIRVSAAA